MQEKAWSTGGLKKFINKNVYGQYISVTPKVVDNGTSVDYSYNVGSTKISELYIINHTKQKIVLFVIKPYENSSYVMYDISYSDFIDNNNILIMSTISSALAAGSINSDYIDVDYYKTMLPYDTGNRIEMIYKTTKYGNPIEI